jgi:hypothetical protein
MPAASTGRLRAEIATALAVLAMLLQVIFSPIVAVAHDYSAETDYGLSLICGHAGDAGSGAPTAPPHLHDCPCCAAGPAHAVLPEPAGFAKPLALAGFAATIGHGKPQVIAVATLSQAQYARAPPTLA